MISLATATALKDAGLRWTDPSNGDCFAIPRPGLEESRFVVSDMTIEVAQLPIGALIKFNGTTEWALDSIEAADVVWLPSEARLRELLGGTFVSLQRNAEPGHSAWTVRTVVNGTADDVEAETADEAYGAAVLTLLQAATS